jgi:hypothetical protein
MPGSPHCCAGRVKDPSQHGQIRSQDATVPHAACSQCSRERRARSDALRPRTCRRQSDARMPQTECERTRTRCTAAWAWPCATRCLQLVMPAAIPRMRITNKIAGIASSFLGVLPARNEASLCEGTIDSFLRRSLIRVCWVIPSRRRNLRDPRRLRHSLRTQLDCGTPPTFAWDQG